MYSENANAAMPKWQLNAVRIVDEDDTQIPLPKRPEKKQEPKHMKFDKDTFIKRYGIVIIAAAAFTVYTILLSAFVASTTEKRVRKELAIEFSAKLTQEIEAYEQSRMAEDLLTGEASFNKAVEDLALSFDQLLANYSMEYGVSRDGCRTIGWVFCARLAQNSSEFGRTPQEIISKKNAWEGNPVAHAVRSEDTELAREISLMFMSGQYPDGFTTDLTFFDRKADGSVIARNQLITGEYTKYWKFETK